jgi:hypothetical protein
MHPLEKPGLPQGKKASAWIFLLGLAVGLASFFYYYAHQLTVAHYDAKAHLLVARRIFDSIEPGYGQIGVNWLPLIHLLYLPLVAIESQYRSGFLPSLISVFSFALSGWLAFRISHRITGSISAGIIAACIIIANPNLEYLQGCPLTEPVAMLLLLLAVDSLIIWRESDHSNLPWLSAVWAALGALCRYEGWYLIAGILLLLAVDFWTRYVPRDRALKAGIVYITVFGVPAAAHFGYIFFRLGDSFFRRVAEGNPDPYVTYRRPFLSALYHLGELSQMAAIITLLLAGAGLLLFCIQRNEWKRRAPILLLWLPSLINISALYWGLIYRLRYSVLLLPAVAVFGSLVITSARGKRSALLMLSIAASALPWLSWFAIRAGWSDTLVPGPGAILLPVAALVLFMLARVKDLYEWALLILCILGMQLPPLARENRPILIETLEHGFIEPERHEVLEYLRRNYDGKRILIDMGKLAPLVYDSGLPVKDFVYNEGGETSWHRALKNPEREVGWLCAQKGDAVAQQLQVDPRWAAGYSLALKTVYFSVYRLRR